jgi:hypothetical protein
MGDEILYTGGCLCGALRYEARGQPLYMGHCYCADCRKASGSGFIPFMAFAAADLTFSAPTRTFVCVSARGSDAVRNTCPTCASLVFGGPVGETDSHTIYAGSLDDPSLFARPWRSSPRAARLGGDPGGVGGVRRAAG